MKKILVRAGNGHLESLGLGTLGQLADAVVRLDAVVTNTRPAPGLEVLDHFVELHLHVVRHRIALTLVVVELLDALGIEAAVPHHHGVRGQHLRLELGQHVDEAVDRVGRLTGRRREPTDGVKRPVGERVPVYDQKSHLLIN